VISQTTQSPARFAAFVARLLERWLDHINELRVINTLCGVTANQQTAAQELAQEVDLMLVIGGRNSANTRHLVEVCQQEGVETHHIETAAEMEAHWFDGRERVGVTAGASTPDSAVEAVVRRIQELVQG
jgi:4-hydroxy-3-methylbut-2-enyl diphosphate reductase